MQADTRLAHFPVGFFAMVMGLSGLSLVWQKAAEVFDTPAVIGQGLLALATLIFGVFALAYGVKWLKHPDAVRAELDHPVKLSFVPAISISLILIGTGMAHSLPAIAETIWTVGAVAHLLLTLFIVNRWIHHQHFEINHINPAWFIPAVGNILVPIAGVGFGQVSASWFFFSIGVVFWLVLLTIIFYRVFFHAPLPGRLLPTLFILVAPPAAGFIGYTQLAGGLDGFARVQVNIALFLTLLLAIQFRRFVALPFFISFWAYSFPLAAMTVAMMVYHQLTQTPWTLWASGLLVAVTTLVIAWLAVATAKAARAGEICVPEG
ncbi:UNVERIFIED_CONTAM: SLAC1 anion channel family protein [Spiribacter pallidus]|jgi:tellurite resistance protein